MSNSPENIPNSPELHVDSAESAAEQLEKLSKSPESNVELSPRDAEAMAERAKLEALDSAISVEAGGKERQNVNAGAPHRRGPVNKKQQEASFKRQIKEVQAELSPSSRAFSKIIHNKAVEKTSDLVGATIARPNAILAGAVFAFILTLGVYVVAKDIGYQLSGFETIASFAVGWVFGLIYDYLRIVITGKK